ncbi:MAG: HlyD family efflux transporter periplasmic adaptor subunit [Pseudohongiellaceae bacterium]
MSIQRFEFVTTPLRKLGKKFTGILFLILSLFFGFIMVATGPSAEPLKRAERAWPISVMTATPVALPPTLLAFGRVEAKQVASLNTTIAAPVREVLVREGDRVEQGELLIQLDAAEGELNLNVSQANHNRNVAMLASVKTDFDLANTLTRQYQELNDIAQSKLRRAVDLNAQSMIADALLDEARQEASQSTITLQQHLSKVADFPNKIAQQQASVDEAAARLERAKLDLLQTQIRAPFAGRVIRSDVSRGDRVMAGATLVEIADYSGLEIRASVPSDVAYSLNQAARQTREVRASATVDGRKLDFILDRLSGDVKTGQSGIDVFFRSSGNEALDIGRVLNITVDLPIEQDVLSMPVYALYENQTIYRIDEQRLQAVHYETVGDYIAADNELRVLIRSADIVAGDRLLASQLPRAITGLLVEPISTSDTSLGIN